VGDKLHTYVEAAELLGKPLSYVNKKVASGELSCLLGRDATWVRRFSEVGLGMPSFGPGKRHRVRGLRFVLIRGKPI
jgi:hypothetical protein